MSKKIMAKRWMHAVLLAVLFLQLWADTTDSRNVNNGSKVRVIVLPHSHEDPGWTHTINEYYHGGYEYKHYGVKTIYDSVTAELWKDPSRRFVAVEVAFFSMWWEDGNTTNLQRSQWRELLRRGQVEFANGGWVMQDEIASHFAADIAQMTLGHRWILDQFGEAYLPTTAWHIDPQGHIGSTAAMLGMMGFDHFVTNRIPENVKTELQDKHQLQFLWEGFPETTNHTSGLSRVHTKVLDRYGYCPPNNPRNLYFWDDYAYWDPLGGAPDMTRNATARDALIAHLQEHVLERAAWLPNNVLLWPWGCDFEFQNATAMFVNMDAVIRHVNADKSLPFTLEHGTLAEYFAADREASIEVTPGVYSPLLQSRAIRRSDFLPYALPANEPPLQSTPPVTPPAHQSWWSGEFTSWPLMKKRTRLGWARLRSTEQLMAMHMMQHPRDHAEMDLVRTLRVASAEAQHHDAVDGTSPARVTLMWEKHLAHGDESAAKAAQEAASALLAGNTSTASPPHYVCDPAALVAALARNQTVLVAVYNPLPHLTSRAVSLPVPSPYIAVSATSNSSVTQWVAVVADVVRQTWPADSWPLNYSDDGADADSDARGQSARTPPGYELVFAANDLPALGFRVFRITPQPLSLLVHPIGADADTMSTLTNHDVEVTFRGGDVVTVQRKGTTDDRLLNVSVRLVAYESNIEGPFASDNYKFYPANGGMPLGRDHGDVDGNSNSDALGDRGDDGGVHGQLLRGRVLLEMRRPFAGGMAMQRVRLFRGLTRGDAWSQALHVSHSVGPLPLNTEVAARWSIPDMATNGSYWSDQSGWYMQPRRFNPHKEPTDPLLNIAANYVPMYTTAFAREDTPWVDQPTPEADKRSIIDPDRQSRRHVAQQLTLVSGHSHGCMGGTPNATLEVMLHRRLSNGWLDDNSTVTSEFAVHVGPVQQAAAARRTLALGMQSPPTTFFLPINDTSTPSSSPLSPSISRSSPARHGSTGLRLPDNVDLLTLEVWSSSNISANKNKTETAVTQGVTLLVRLMHLFEAGEHPRLSAPARVDLKNFLTLLGGVGRPVRISTRTLHAVKATTHTACGLSDGGVLWLHPLDICTYLVDF